MNHDHDRARRIDRDSIERAKSESPRGEGNVAFLITSEMAKIKKAGQSSTVHQAFADDVPVNSSELALAMRVSRVTVYRWRANGYRFEFGNRTTAGHLKAWLRKREAAQKPGDPDLSRYVLKSVLAPMRLD